MNSEESIQMATALVLQLIVLSSWTVWCVCVCRLNSEESIQMVTALALQLIQCVVKLPSQESSRPSSPTEESDPKRQQKVGYWATEVITACWCITLQLFY